MDFRNTSYSGSALKNGSYKLEGSSQLNDTYHVVQFSILITSKDSQESVRPNVGIHFLSVISKAVLELGLRIFLSSTKNGQSHEKIDLSSLKPRHTTVYNSVTYERCGSFGPFVTNPKLEPSIVQRHVCLLSTYFTNALAAWKHGGNVDMHVALQSNVFDLQGTRFLTQDCPRQWVIQRTVTRQMAQELEQQLCGPIRRYKGVRWRPERKHPWVAEIKLSKQKKAWIGNFDTQEEAARAFDVAVIHHGKQTTLNFEGSRNLVPPTQLYNQLAS
jgi:hypothetical protein